MTKILKAGAVYLLVVFGVGFVLGTIRQLVVVPAVGERWAELGEAPLMLVASYLTARWAVRRYKVSSRPLLRLAVGLVALAPFPGRGAWCRLAAQEPDDSGIPRYPRSSFGGGLPGVARAVRVDALVGRAALGKTVLPPAVRSARAGVVPKPLPARSVATR